jgi:omega-amidase
LFARSYLVAIPVFAVSAKINSRKQKMRECRRDKRYSYLLTYRTKIEIDNSIMMMNPWFTSYRRPLALWITTTSITVTSTRTISALSLPRQQQQQLRRNIGTATTTSTMNNNIALSVSTIQTADRNTWKQKKRISTSKLMSARTTSTNAVMEGEEENQQEPKQFRVALCQFLVTEDKMTNLQTCSQYIDDAVSRSMTETNNTKKIDLLVLPEIWNSPYATAAFAEYAEPIPDTATTTNDDESRIDVVVDAPSVQLLRQKAIQHQIYIVGGSIPEVDTSSNNNDDRTLYNTCIVFNPRGQIIAKHRKVHLFDIDVPNGITFRESDTLSSGSQITSFVTPWCNIGIGICYDIRFPEYAMLLGQTCQVLIYPGAFNLITGPAHWELLQRARAVDTQSYVLTASPARTITTTVETEGSGSGSSNSRNKYPPYSAWGHSTVVAPWGDIVATTDESESIVIADIDLTKVDTMRQSIPVRNQKRTDLYTLETTA